MEANQSRKRKRISKRDKPNRRGRIIIRNLPFKASEENLKEHFKEFGEITEVKLLKRADGKLVGCAFIQYAVVQSAAKAIHHRSGKEFLGRPIICDWAIAKDAYVKNVAEYQVCHDVEVKEEPIEIKEEKDELIEVNVDHIKVDRESDQSDESDCDEQGGDDESDSNDGSEEEIEDQVEHVEPEVKKPRVVSNDVNEGKTVFIKNIPFMATNEDVAECMSQFGALYYALVCIDPITEHSKGTAFVKYKSEADAETCLEAGTELTLMGNVLDCHRAVSKSQLEQKHVKPTKKDSRNLYLVKEGVILAGSKAAQTVSAGDMARRLQLERWKTQMLRNLNMFVSRNRLVIHNLPESYDDTRLRQLLAMHTGPRAIIRECRVMRDMKQLDQAGRGRSKEFAFVTFQEHDDALKLLRAINNNPNVFGEARRPIVSFSIENRAVMNAKKQRTERSRLNNPTSNLKQSRKPQHGSHDSEKSKEDGAIGAKEFAGLAAKAGETKLRSRQKLKKQASIHRENVKRRKTQLKSRQQGRMEHIRQPQQKRSTRMAKERDGFSQLVSRYKSALSARDHTAKSKWYSE